MILLLPPLSRVITGVEKHTGVITPILTKSLEGALKRRIRKRLPRGRINSVMGGICVQENAMIINPQSKVYIVKIEKDM